MCVLWAWGATSCDREGVSQCAGESVSLRVPARPAPRPGRCGRAERTPPSSGLESRRETGSRGREARPDGGEAGRAGGRAGG